LVEDAHGEGRQECEQDVVHGQSPGLENRLP
jgi:hypothetical protein